MILYTDWLAGYLLQILYIKGLVFLFRVAKNYINKIR